MKSQLKKIPLNLVFLIFVFILSVFYTFNAFKLSFGTFRSPGPGFIPRIVGVATCVVSCGLFISDYLKKSRPEADMDYPVKILLFLVCFIGYALIFKPVGYVISTVVFTFLLCLIMGNRIRSAAIISICTGIAFFLVFSLLAVPLPKGILG